jgi:hypothetical protein
MSLKVSCGGKNGLLVGELTATKFGHLQSLLEEKVCQQLSPIEYPYSASGGGREGIWYLYFTKENCIETIILMYSSIVQYRWMMIVE